MALVETRYIGSCGHTYVHRHPPEEKPKNFWSLRCPRCSHVRGQGPLRVFTPVPTFTPADW